MHLIEQSVCNHIHLVCLPYCILSLRSQGVKPFCFFARLAVRDRRRNRVAVFLFSFGSLVGGSVEEGHPVQNESSPQPSHTQQPSSTARKKHLCPPTVI